MQSHAKKLLDRFDDISGVESRNLLEGGLADGGSALKCLIRVQNAENSLRRPNFFKKIPQKLVELGA